MKYPVPLYFIKNYLHCYVTKTYQPLELQTLVVSALVYSINRCHPNKWKLVTIQNTLVNRYCLYTCTNLDGLFLVNLAKINDAEWDFGN